jgi:type II secretory pathway component PulJ
MSSTPELIRIAIFALLAGIAVPVLVQLFISLRTLDRSARALERKLDETLSLIAGTVANANRPTTGSDTLALLLGALGPALAAGVRAFRASAAAAPATAEASPPNGAPSQPG